MQRPRSILLTCTVNLGDVVLATSTAVLIKKSFPECRVCMLVKAGVEEVLQNHPFIDEVIALDNKAKSKSWKQMWRFVREIKSHDFDMSIALDRKLRPALLTLLAGIPVRVGPDKVFDYKPSKVTLLYNRIVKTPTDFLHTHQAEIFQTIVRKALNITGNAKPILGEEGAAAGRTAIDLLNGCEGHERKIALCIKGTYPLRNWPVSHFVQLINRLQEKYDAMFIIVGGEADKIDANEVCEMTKARVLNLCGKTSLSELMALLRECELLITIDTGTMHIAAALDVPTVGLFRCATQWRWAPYSDRGKVVTSNMICNLIDRPEACPVEPCPALRDLSIYPCVERITVKQLEDAVEMVLITS